MWQRFITGALLIVFLIAVLIFGGYVFGAVAFIVCGLCVFEELVRHEAGRPPPRLLADLRSAFAVRAADAVRAPAGDRAGADACLLYRDLCRDAARESRN